MTDARFEEIRKQSQQAPAPPTPTLISSEARVAAAPGVAAAATLAAAIFHPSFSNAPPGRKELRRNGGIGAFAGCSSLPYRLPAPQKSRNCTRLRHPDSGVQRAAAESTLRPFADGGQGITCSPLHSFLAPRQTRLSVLCFGKSCSFQPGAHSIRRHRLHFPGADQ
jgi:hypothetical protein